MALLLLRRLLSSKRTGAGELDSIKCRAVVLITFFLSIGGAASPRRSTPHRMLETTMDNTPTPTELDEAAVMDRHGITRVPAFQYIYNTFRYSNLSDAVAEAKRNPVTATLRTRMRGN